MSSTEQLDALRGQNKDLLNRLKRQKEKLESVSSCSQGRKREREDEAEERTLAEGIVTRTGGDRRSALSKLTDVVHPYKQGEHKLLRPPAEPPIHNKGGSTCPYAQFTPVSPQYLSGDPCERQTGIAHASLLTSKHRWGTSGCTDSSDIFKNSDRHLQDRLQDTRSLGNKSCLVNHNKEQREARSRVTFQSDKCEEIPSCDRHRVQPLLGYDWIAGVLDSEDSLIERSDDFFNDLRMFRSLHKDECVHSSQAEFSEENHSGLPLRTDKDEPDTDTDTHQCTFSYRINSRLFPVPLHSEEHCPVCKEHKSTHPHTSAEPALIRVSIPRSTLLPPHKYKAHRRCSFDPSDSLGLPSHCLSGWSHTGQSPVPPPSTLDLRSSLNTKSSTESQNKELEDLSVPKVSCHHISNVSRLARHNFQHFSSQKPTQKQ